MSDKLRVVLAQINPTVGDIPANVNLLIKSLQQARDELQADMIIFPELALTGYPPEDWLLRNDFAQTVETALKQLIAATTGIAVVVGYPEYNGAQCYNALAFIEEKKLIQSYHKQMLPNYEVFDEKRYFTAGNETAIIKWRDHTLAFLICEDIWHTSPLQPLVDKTVDALIIINASPFDKHKAEQREDLLIHAAKKLKAPIFYVNTIGGQDELVFDGGSLVINANGEIAARANYFQTQQLMVTCDRKGHQLVPQSVPLSAALSEQERIYQALVLALRDYLAKNRCHSVLVGLSGGIDSALTLAIAVDALGSANVTAVYMPSRYSAPISGEDSKAQADYLGVNYHVISIDDLYENYLNTLQPLFTGLPADVTEQNIQARIRANLLMALSNKTGKFLITTGNKSEIAMGYATLYGDMCGAFAVLKDVYKMMVYQLARYRNGLSPSPIIPERVIERAPSAELAPGQIDEDSLPPYRILDGILEKLIEQKQSAAQIIAAGYEAETVNKVIYLLRCNEYKRRQGAVGPKVTSCAFGKDWRFPIRAITLKS